MVDETTFGREPVQLVELEQQRCARRFGVAPCTASIGDGPRCYQTWTTCLSRANILPTGSIKWLFVKPTILAGDMASGSPIVRTYSRTGEAIRTNPIPCLVSVSQSAGRINVGASRDGESPFGVRSNVTVQFKDIPWNDHVGDFYLADRSGVRGNFWQKWSARNQFYAHMTVRIYEGYRGQDLSEMQQRLYLVEKIDGPDAEGNVTLTGVDPLRLADGKRSMFPRATEMRLVSAITNVATTGLQISASAADISDVFGNTGATKYLRIGSEIISYTGTTGTGPYTLTGVTRGVLGTTAAAASADASAQRVGRFSARNCWDALYDLLTGHTDLPAGYINKTQWDQEGALYLSGFDVDATIHEPTAIETLCGELMQQCSFYIWWDERLQTIPMKAVRPERSSAVLTDDENFLKGSVSITRDADGWFTQLFVYYQQRDPTKGFDETNFQRVRALVDGEVEMAAAADTVRQKVIYSRWLRNESQAFELLGRLLGRFRSVPRYLYFTLDAKDRSIKVGDVLTAETSVATDTEGNVLGQRWQVISFEEIEPGHAVRYDLQEFQFQGQRFGIYMADSGGPDFDAATDEDKEAGAWFADDDGEMPDGSNPYMYQ